LKSGIICGCWQEHADVPRALLRAYRDGRPCSGRSENGNEIPPPHATPFIYVDGTDYQMISRRAF
jgi:hypothetical protein